MLISNAFFRSNIQKEVQTKIENALEWYDADKIGAIGELLSKMRFYLINMHW